MKYVCDAPRGRTWFRITTEGEAAKESALMQHAVEKHFMREQERSRQCYMPISKVTFEQEIGLKAHFERDMPMFLTLRDGDGTAKVTAMLPPGGRDRSTFKIIIVGPQNADPYPEHGDAIQALGRHFGIALDRSRCYPYNRGSL
jgi:hypothetical protein